MGSSTVAMSLLSVLFVVASINFATCNPSKRQTTINGATECVVDPGLERRTILLEGAATTWAATLPPMLVALQEISQTMKEHEQHEAHADATGMDCSQIYAKGHNTSGVYHVGHHSHNMHVDHHDPFYVYCDMETDGGGWTVFQKRFNGKTRFYRGWESYVSGFGHLDGEQWLGLEKLSELTSYAKYEMRVDLQRFNGETAYAAYENFEVADSIDGYKLTVGGYSGTAGDALANHNNHPFSTKDRDYDASNSNCATQSKGAWWYYNCHDSNLNGLYLGSTSDNKGMVWNTWQDSEGLKASTMKIRRKN